MKTFFRSVAMLLGLGLLPVAAHAQKKVIIEDEEPNSVMFVSTNKAGDEIIRIMNETRLPRFHEPKAPRFVLTDRQGKFALGIGGYVRATAEYDFGGIVKDVDFYPALIPNKGSADRARQPVPDGYQHFHPLPEAGGTYQTFRGFRRLHRCKLPWRRKNLRTAKCLCHLPRLYPGIQLW